MSGGPRRELTVALAGCVLAGGLALSSSAQRWVEVTVTRPRPLPPLVESLTGAQAAPLVPACGLLLLAAGVAVLAVRGAGRVVVGLLVAAAGLGLAWSALRGLTGGLTSAAAQDAAGVVGGSAAGEVSAGWPGVAVVAGLLAVGAGLLVAVRGRRWPGMGRRYERTSGERTGGERAGGPMAVATVRARAARPVTSEDEHQAAWKALDRGEDPTADPTPDAPPTGAIDPPGPRGSRTV